MIAEIQCGAIALIMGVALRSLCSNFTTGRGVPLATTKCLTPPGEGPHARSGNVVKAGQEPWQSTEGFSGDSEPCSRPRRTAIERLVALMDSKNESVAVRSLPARLRRSSMSMREGIAVKPRCFDPYLSAGEAEARTQSGVAFDLQR